MDNDNRFNSGNSRPTYEMDTRISLEAGDAARGGVQGFQELCA
ncbi:MAG: hypothetical protein WC614_13440 [bacterium]